MRELRGKVAVVTGAASGIGRALAERFASEGMRVALADVEEAPLREAASELDAFAVKTDVSDRASVDAFADAVFDRFGAAHVLCNNAGVAGGGGALWTTTANDWSWVLGVNLMGVVHGVQAFVPRMLAGGDEGHIVNTSSVLGLSTGPASIYSVTKHAVTRLSEGLHYDLRAAGSRIGVSVLCPGMIATHIVSAERNRPEHLRNETPPPPGREAIQQRFLEQGMPAAEVATMVVDAIEADRFYVLTHPDMIREAVERRFRGILENALPDAQQVGRIV